MSELTQLVNDIEEVKSELARLNSKKCHIEIKLKEELIREGLVDALTVNYNRLRVMIHRGI